MPEACIAWTRTEIILTDPVKGRPADWVPLRTIGAALGVRKTGSNRRLSQSATLPLTSPWPAETGRGDFGANLKAKKE